MGVPERRITRSVKSEVICCNPVSGFCLRVRSCAGEL